MSIATSFAFVLAAASQISAAPCTSLPGWESAIANRDIRWIVIGEIHGNNESPAIFADAVCLTARSRRVVVALELGADTQDAIDAFMASDGGSAARRALFGTYPWNSDIKDGRSSEAYFRLLDRLRRMRRSGSIAGVVAFEPGSGEFKGQPFLPDPGFSEEAMARRVRDAAQPGVTVVALVGNIHAMRTRINSRGGYLPMAGWFPREQLLTFDIDGRSGHSWACMGQPMSCAPHPFPNRNVDRPRGVIMNESSAGPYSGVIVLGAPFTVSPPQHTAATGRSD